MSVTFVVQTINIFHLVKTSTIDDEVQIMLNLTVYKNYILGTQYILNTFYVIDHELRIVDAVHIMGSATIARYFDIGDVSTIRTIAAILPNMVIAEHNVIGVRDIVTRNTAPYCICVGVLTQ